SNERREFDRRGDGENRFRVLGGYPSSRSLEVSMMKKNLMTIIVFGLVMAASSYTTAVAEEADQALLRAISGAKVTLVQGIAQVAKGTEVPTEAKYEMKDGNGKPVFEVMTAQGNTAKTTFYDLMTGEPAGG